MVLDVGDQQPEGTEHPWEWRHHEAGYVKHLGQPGGVDRAAAAEGEEDEPPGVPAPLAGHGAKSAGHIGIDQQMDAVGRLNLGQAQGQGHVPGNGLPGQFPVNGEVAAQQVFRVEIAQQHVGVSDGGVPAAQAVAGRPRHRSGALRPHPDGAAAVHRGDAAAAGSHFGKVDCGYAEDVPGTSEQAMANADVAAHLRLRGLQNFAVFDDASLGGGAAHVQRHQVFHAQAVTQVIGSHHAGGGAGLYAVDRLLHGDAGSGQAAVGLHDGQGDGDAHILQTFGQQAQVTFHYWADVTVYHRGAGALVLFHLRQ